MGALVGLASCAEAEFCIVADCWQVSPYSRCIDTDSRVGGGGHHTWTPAQKAALSQQQALLIAGQLEPDAASKAKSTSASYVLLNYPVGKAATHTNLSDVAAWMIVYQKIPRQPAAASVEPTPLPLTYQNLYVFLDANSGKELLAIWT